ncbi:hypothetical protein CYR55_09560 [Chimaeribacter californicus]|uniref:YdgH/BhsA/McbA-like domain-containing protein n=1 Tax=Chimaeribacter californicus TaxID=2060067 RepID=A0A2N5E8G2_9GAMM|nr:YdgH/BhsA/McbA-like domain containing protein [Chimaeribacter californicus]PLR37954.1 hypothetical protein CYR55_09560 [Chimaeribacter californicus]
MKNIKYFAVAVALSLAAFTGTAGAATLTQQDAGEKLGVVTASGATDLSTVEAQLAAKAQQAGASSYRIIAVSGNNKLHGTAELYK